MSRPYAEVIGDPIVHSKSPLIHTFWLERLGLDAAYRACHVRPEDLAGYFAARRADSDWRGCNVTIPHKEQVARFLDSVTPEAAKVGAVNTVFRHPRDGLGGTNTDVDGVREALRGVHLAERPVVVIGAGGAARAAFAHLEGLGCSQVRVVVRDRSKAERVLEHFALPGRTFAFTDGEEPLAGAAAVINATQLGMVAQPAMPRFLLDGLALTAADCLVFDMVYAPLQTELLKRAGELGRPSSHGLTMLVGQARTAFARFFGKSPPSGYDVDLFGRLTS